MYQEFRLGIHADEGERILLAVVVRTFKQECVWIYISDFQIDAYRGYNVSQDFPSFYSYRDFHDPLVVFS